jgi:uncharacterized membrane protein YhaH (DUF805 family)
MAAELTNPYAAPHAAVAGAGSDEETQEVRILAVSGRMGRVRYVANLMGTYLLFAMVLGGIVGGMSAAMGGMRGGGSPLFWVITGVGYIAMTVLFFMLAIQRCHDFDQPGWWSLLFLVPFVNLLFGLFLIFMPGTQGHNRWGARTPPNSTFSVIIACLLPGLFVIGIIAAIALPAYQDYAKRAQVSAPR